EPQTWIPAAKFSNSPVRNRQPSTVNRQPSTANRQPPTACDASEFFVSSNGSLKGSRELEESVLPT
ncbi:MAG: hypothetical protein ABJE10_01930, partial [bacterium]